MWIVCNVTNYGDGVYFGGIYRSLKKAQARLEWCEEHLSDDGDSWRLEFVPSQIPVNYNDTF